MKCVILKKSREIIRIPDHEAQNIVSANLATFCPKHLWKAQRDETTVIGDRKR